MLLKRASKVTPKPLAVAVAVDSDVRAKAIRILTKKLRRPPTPAEISKRVKTLLKRANKKTNTLVSEHTGTKQTLEQQGMDSYWTINGNVTGLHSSVHSNTLTFTLGSTEDDSFLATRRLDEGETSFTFGNLVRGVSYFLKVEGQGYEAVATRVVASPTSASLSTVDVDVQLKEATNTGDTFRYEWAMDASRAGAAATVHTVDPPVVKFLGNDVVLSDDQAAFKLQRTHGVLLANDGVAWTSEYAYRLLETISAIPAKSKFAPSKWSLVEESIENDIQITMARTGERTVRVSADAFVNAAPQAVTVDGVRGTYFSRRLHHAAVRFVVNDGKANGSMDHIMASRYGCTTKIAKDEYAALTARTTQETADKFQPFEKHPEELFLLLNMFEELPAGFHAIPGLSYLLRRADGFKHPLYPQAPAVAWPTAHKESYVEFMETAFGTDLRHTRRLILHEKAHFMWDNLFTDELRSDWTTLAGWSKDSKTQSGWATTEVRMLCECILEMGITLPSGLNEFTFLIYSSKVHSVVRILATNAGGILPSKCCAGSAHCRNALI